jgi:hypothetical protein
LIKTWSYSSPRYNLAIVCNLNFLFAPNIFCLLPSGGVIDEHCASDVVSLPAATRGEEDCSELDDTGGSQL